jgi:glutamyl-Q tRNA(Asp) synthetase
LVAAVASYLDARSQGGIWLVRIEDLDRPREVAGSADDILRTLERFGFEWTESILRQGERREAYEAALASLRRQHLAYPCSCSRTEIQASQPADRAPDDELFYPGWCRNGVRAPGRPTAERFCVPAAPIRFIDRIQGPLEFDLSGQIGDFVVRRRDGLFAYQLAVVVDDAFQGISHVVRGADLLSSTPRQIALQRALDLQTPEYAHLPVATNRNGIKLSKSAGAAALVGAPVRELWRALNFLRQAPPAELCRGDLQTLWAWASEHWHLQPLHGMRYAAIDEP